MKYPPWSAGLSIGLRCRSCIWVRGMMTSCCWMNCLSSCMPAGRDGRPSAPYAHTAIAGNFRNNRYNNDDNCRLMIFIRFWLSWLRLSDRTCADRYCHGYKILIQSVRCKQTSRPKVKAGSAQKPSRLTSPKNGSIHTTFHGCVRNMLQCPDFFRLLCRSILSVKGQVL